MKVKNIALLAIVAMLPSLLSAGAGTTRELRQMQAERGYGMAGISRGRLTEAPVGTRERKASKFEIQQIKQATKMLSRDQTNFLKQCDIVFGAITLGTKRIKEAAFDVSGISKNADEFYDFIKKAAPLATSAYMKNKLGQLLACALDANLAENLPGGISSANERNQLYLWYIDFKAVKSARKMATQFAGIQVLKYPLHKGSYPELLDNPSSAIEYRVENVQKERIVQFVYDIFVALTNGNPSGKLDFTKKVIMKTGTAVPTAEFIIKVAALNPTGAELVAFKQLLEKAQTSVDGDLMNIVSKKLKTQLYEIYNQSTFKTQAMVSKGSATFAGYPVVRPIAKATTGLLRNTLTKLTTAAHIPQACYDILYVTTGGTFEEKDIKVDSKGMSQNDDEIAAIITKSNSLKPKHSAIVDLVRKLTGKPGTNSVELQNAMMSVLY